LFITVHPDQIAPRVLECLDRIIVVGDEPSSALRAFCEARGRQTESTCGGLTKQDNRLNRRPCILAWVGAGAGLAAWLART